MRIVTEKFLVEVAKAHPKAAKYLQAWHRIATLSAWRSLADVRRDYPATDAITVSSGRRILIFNVCGNDYRFICAAHFNTQLIYTLRFLTHAEYSKDNWKTEL